VPSAAPRVFVLLPRSRHMALGKSVKQRPSVSHWESAPASR
jgi:hypothetical protein